MSTLAGLLESLFSLSCSTLVSVWQSPRGYGGHGVFLSLVKM